MPHQCTKCGEQYPDGDTRILSGCKCGNNKFLYIPKVKKDSEEQIREIEEQLTDIGIASVKIIAPGKYELNLERLLQSDEIVIALEEDGKYVIHLPSLLKKKGRKG
ncbi:Zn-ribbon containing protein [Archaeoglobus sulfaticallidus PM70-1]|uniref:Zn-ribbon containing protein n=1 Tax=Archaeoglobus sulfaticallidus PM70-1 TaxID=387631 RepID=N0BFH6_9EURY|nr:Zn-ribbon domain-containing protein [Archaeoglobus sulfaticallidus]AGK60997.1 Zn-ribbon containing protein [Archaeoglobus sulfaticallidus PM70-1]